MDRKIIINNDKLKICFSFPQNKKETRYVLPTSFPSADNNNI